MADFILLMHDDAKSGSAQDWDTYLKRLRASGSFEGGSAIGGGICVRKDGATAPSIAKHLTGYLRVTATNLGEVMKLLAGNPVYEAGGTVEIRGLPRD